MDDSRSTSSDDHKICSPELVANGYPRDATLLYYRQSLVAPQQFGASVGSKLHESLV
jgi:hypothetical protein